TDLWREGETVDEDKDGSGEVEFEEGLGRGEFDDLVVLEEAVVAAASQFSEAIFESVGEVEDWFELCDFEGLLCGGFSGLRRFGGSCLFGRGGLHGLEFDFCALDGEESVDACAFGLRQNRGNDFVDSVGLDGAAAVKAGHGAATGVEEA